MASSNTNDSDDVRADIVQLLLDKVADDPYPSVTMMDLVEEMLGPTTARIMQRC